MTISKKINQAINRVSNAMEAMAAEKVKRIYESRIGRELDRKSNAKYDRKRKHTELTHTIHCTCSNQSGRVEYANHNPV